jgi:hypothetical protein
MALRFIGFFLVLFFIEGCSGPLQPKKIEGNEVGTRDERIEFHKKEVERYKAAVEKEKESLSNALTEQRMNDIRASRLKKDRYLLRLQQHEDKLKELEELKG